MNLEGGGGRRRKRLLPKKRNLWGEAATQSLMEKGGVMVSDGEEAAGRRGRDEGKSPHAKGSKKRHWHQNAVSSFCRKNHALFSSGKEGLPRAGRKSCHGDGPGTQEK